MNELLIFVIGVALILALHFLLWQKVYKDWLGYLKGIRKALLFIGCLLGELLITVLFGIYALNLG